MGNFPLCNGFLRSCDTCSDSPSTKQYNSDSTVLWVPVQCYVSFTKPPIFQVRDSPANIKTNKIHDHGLSQYLFTKTITCKLSTKTDQHFYRLPKRKTIFILIQKTQYCNNTHLKNGMKFWIYLMWANKISHNYQFYGRTFLRLCSLAAAIPILKVM